MIPFYFELRPAQRIGGRKLIREQVPVKAFHQFGGGLVVHDPETRNDASDACTEEVTICAASTIPSFSLWALATSSLLPGVVTDLHELISNVSTTCSACLWSGS